MDNFDVKYYKADDWQMINETMYDIIVEWPFGFNKLFNQNYGFISKNDEWYYFEVDTKTVTFPINEKKNKKWKIK